VSAAPEQIVAVVLAGGLGTRIRHLLPNLPKPMASVCERPFIEWVIRYLAAQNVRRIVISTGYRGDVIERHFASKPVKEVAVQCIAEPEPLGTAGGFLNAVQASGYRPRAWLVLNGDSLALAPLGSLLGALNEAECSGALLGVSMNDASRYGAITSDSKQQLLRFEEKQPGSGVINAGVYLFRHAVVEAFPTQVPLSFEKEVFPDLIARKAHLKVCVVEAPFLDIGTPESLRCAETFVSENRGHFAE
jgi:D-glycero-alpha-D-manno-heptose 1-phosphate guanylyltransferase